MHQNLIKYNSTETSIVNANKNRHYIFEQDLAVLLSCSNSNINEDISYKPILIEMPQCLNYLDSINGNSIHKINFYYSITDIIYDIYDDPRLKSFRNVGIMFYPYEKHYNGLILLKIKNRNSEEYIFPKNNVLYIVLGKRQTLILTFFLILHLYSPIIMILSLLYANPISLTTPFTLSKLVNSDTFMFKLSIFFSSFLISPFIFSTLKLRLPIDAPQKT